MFDDWTPSDPIAELGGSVLPQWVSEDGTHDPGKLYHATVVSRISGGEDEDEGMPRQLELVRKWAKHGIEARRTYVQLTDAETDALTMLWRLVYPKPGEEREPFATPDEGEWEYPAQVYRHVKGLLEEYAALMDAIRVELRAMGAAVPPELVALVGNDDREALRGIRDRISQARARGRERTKKAREQ